MRPRPDLSGFDERFKHLSPEEREEAEDRLLRYLELVVRIVDERRALTDEEDDRMLMI